MPPNPFAFSRVFLAKAHGICSLRTPDGATRDIHSIMRSTPPASGLYILFVCPMNCTTATNKRFSPVKMVMHYLARLESGDPVTARLVPPGCSPATGATP